MAGPVGLDGDQVAQEPERLPFAVAKQVGTGPGGRRRTLPSEDRSGQRRPSSARARPWGRAEAPGEARAPGSAQHRPPAGRPSPLGPGPRLRAGESGRLPPGDFRPRTPRAAGDRRRRWRGRGAKGRWPRPSAGRKPAVGKGAPQPPPRFGAAETRGSGNPRRGGEATPRGSPRPSHRPTCAPRLLPSNSRSKGGTPSPRCQGVGPAGVAPRPSEGGSSAAAPAIRPRGRPPGRSPRCAAGPP